MPERAIALVRRLPNGWVTSQEAATAWGKEETSSRVAQVISALHQFDLVEVEGHKLARRLRLTKLACAILETSDTSALEYAARSPRVFDELLEAMRHPTSHAALLARLTTDRSAPFNPRAAQDVLRLFKQTVKFANLPTGPNDIDEVIQSRHVVAEEVLSMGKIRIQYRGEPDRKDFQELRDHFESKLKD